VSDERNVVVRNRRALRNYWVEERIEAGLRLLGPEVKSLRAGQASLAEAYAAFRDGELFLLELRKLESAVTRKGFTLIPLQLYFLRGHAKVELGVARGRKHHDKREALKEQEARREARKAEGRRGVQ
jgi:SsrA-binding protein